MLSLSQPQLSRHWALDYKLQREFTFVAITAVFVPCSAKTKEPMSGLCQTIGELQTAYTQGFLIAAEDFNQAKMKPVPQHFHEQVDCATREVKRLDM